MFLDEHTGAPTAIVDPASGVEVPLGFGIAVESGGVEVPGAMGGLAYRDTELSSMDGIVSGSLDHVTTGPSERFAFEARAGEWRVRYTVAFRDEHPRVALRVAVSPGPELDEGVVRDLHVSVDLPAETIRDWRVEAPGNMLRPGVRARDVAGPVSVLTAGDQLGSPGLVALHRDETPLTLILWPMSRSESGEVTVEPADGGLRWRLRTQLAGAVPAGEWLEHGPIYMDLVARPWAEVRSELTQWYGSIHVSTPPDQADWGTAANIFEVMVGMAPFHGGQEYCPYPTLRDLIEDLDRIADLGFDCVQLMPRHPYPSYNIHRPGDVATTYGEPEELRALVHACHERGMRLVVDILLHGVLDKTSMRKAIEVVEKGPYASRLDDPCSDPYELATVEISWCRHILAYAPYWLGGSPEHHPLLDEHPEWFMRDSNGEVTGVYTNALDIANEEWQDLFISTCSDMVNDYGIDGFRLDAPLYNRHANWSDATRRHASYSNLGSLRLLRKLRRRLRRISSATSSCTRSRPGCSFASRSTSATPTRRTG